MASVDKERDRWVSDGFDSRRSTKILKLKNMETIAFILFVAFSLLLIVSGSVGIALLFRKYGDGWEYRREIEKEGNEDKVGKEVSNG